MKTFFLSCAVAPVLALALLGPVSAQSGAAGDPGQSSNTATGGGSGMRAATPAAASSTAGDHAVRRASRVIGADVVDAQGRKVGDIKDIIFDPDRAQVAYAVVGFGGVMGVGTQYYAIPWNVLHQPATGTERAERFVISMTREQLRNAPSFAGNRWPDMANESWHRDVSRFWAQAPYWEAPAVGAAGSRGVAPTMGGSGTGGPAGSSNRSGSGSGSGTYGR